MGSPLLQRHTKLALDALLEGFADPARAETTYHIDPDYSKPMGQKGTEPENVHYGNDPVDGTPCTQCGQLITDYEQLTDKRACLDGTDYHHVQAEDLGVLLDKWMNNKTAKKNQDPRINQWMMEFMENQPTGMTFPQYLEKKKQESARTFPRAASNDDVDPDLNPEDKIFKRSLEAVLAAAGGRKFMYQFKYAEDVSEHLQSVVKTGAAMVDFKTIWAWAEKHFPKKAHKTKTAAVEQKLTPDVLPQRDDMRGHLDEDVKKDIADMVNVPEKQGVKGVHIGAPEPEKRYPDSPEGAVQCLRDMSSGLNLQGATARPDPSVQGVWQVTMKGGQRVIVYLGGYKDPFGNVRTSNDFEVEDEKEASTKTSDLGDAMRQDVQDDIPNEQISQYRREAYQSFLQDEFMQQEAQLNQWTMEELWAQIGVEYANELWQSHQASVKSRLDKSFCPNCKRSNLIQVESLETKVASRAPLAECGDCGSFFTF